MKNLMNAREFGELIGVTERRVNQLCQQGIVDKQAGKIDVAKNVKAYCRHQAQGGGDVRQRQVELKNAILEVKLAEKKKELVSVEDMRRFAVRQVFAAKTRLLAIPATMAQRLCLTNDPIEIQNELRREICDALSELSKGDWNQPLAIPAAA